MEARDAFDTNQTRLNTAFDEYTRAQKELANYQVDYYKKLVEQKEIANEIRSQLEQQQSDATDENIRVLKDKLEKNRSFIRRMTMLQPLIEDFKTPDEINEQFERQEQEDDKFKKLKRLKSIPQYADYESSKWAEDFEAAQEFYTNRNREIQQEIKNLEALLNLYEGNNPDSLFNWALNQKSPLSLAQETVLMNFKDVYIKKIAPNVLLKVIIVI